MITALATPAAGAVLPDANNTVIKIQSTNGEGHYFRAKIYINGELFDEQGWSRADAFTASKDLKKLYHAYFAPAFNPAFVNQLAEVTDLKRLVAITIEEYSLDTGELTATLSLPAFHILYNTKPEAFSDTVPLRLLGMGADAAVVPKNGKITLPFYVNQESGNVRVVLKDNFGTVIDDRTVNDVSGKKVFLYQFDLSPVAFSYQTLWLTAEISAGAAALAKKPVYRLNRLPDYPVKELAYLDNFGFFRYAYFDGELEHESGLSVETYDAADGTEKVYEINEESTYTINTGSLRESEKGIIAMVANSPDTRLKNGAEWLPVVPKLKKYEVFKDRKHQYSESLQFTMRRGTDIANTGLITVVAPDPDIVITEFDVVGTQLAIHFVLNNGYAPTGLRVQYRTSPSNPWLSNTGSPASPRTINLPSGIYQVRLIDTNGISPASAIATNVIV